MPGSTSTAGWWAPSTSPPDLPAGADAEGCSAFMGRDKKAQGDLTFVLDGPRGVEVVRGIDRGDVVATLADMESAAPGAST